MDGIVTILVAKSDGTEGANMLHRALKRADVPASLLVWHGREWRGNCLERIPSVLVRWGSTKKTLLDNLAGVVVNSPEAIRDCANKRRARWLLQKNGIPVPATWFKYENVIPPFIARPRYHQGGVELHLISNDKEKEKFDGYSDNHWYYSSLYPKEREYRVHVGHGKVLCAYDKNIEPGSLKGNQTQGRPWTLITDYIKGIDEISINACKVLGLQTGAVDVMVSSKHFKPAVVCEVNSMPSVKTDTLADYYAGYFKELHERVINKRK